MQENAAAPEAPEAIQTDTNMASQPSDSVPSPSTSNPELPPPTPDAQPEEDQSPRWRCHECGKDDNLASETICANEECSHKMCLVDCIQLFPRRLRGKRKAPPAPSAAETPAAKKVATVTGTAADGPAGVSGDKKGKAEKKVRVLKPGEQAVAELVNRWRDFSTRNAPALGQERLTMTQTFQIMNRSYLLGRQSGNGVTSAGGKEVQASSVQNGEGEEEDGTHGDPKPDEAGDGVE